MARKLIGLMIPSVHEHFDLFVPDDVPVSTMTRLMSEGVEELCEGRYTSSHSELLVLCEPQMVLNSEKTLAEQGVQDGTQLMLF